MNNCVFGGNIGQSELKTVGETSLLAFSIAVERSYQKDKENKKVDWVNCSLWGSRASSLEKYIVKGAAVVVSGEMQSNKKEDGRVFWNLNVNQVDITKWAEDNKKGDEINPDDFASVQDDDDLPF